MGTINYGTSEYITIGFEPMDACVLEQDETFVETMQANVDEYGGTIEEEISAFIYREQVEMFYTVTAIRAKYEFYYFYVAVKRGYYEGFYIEISQNYPLCYDTYEDKKFAQKEITRIKRFLLECIDAGLVQVFPGWCTSYKGYEETKAGINSAVHEMREDVRMTPTWRQYERG